MLTRINLFFLQQSLSPSTFPPKRRHNSSRMKQLSNAGTKQYMESSRELTVLRGPAAVGICVDFKRFDYSLCGKISNNSGRGGDKNVF